MYVLNGQFLHIKPQNKYKFLKNEHIYFLLLWLDLSNTWD